jgi:hypothetical protein
MLVGVSIVVDVYMCSMLRYALAFWFNHCTFLSMCVLLWFYVYIVGRKCI